MFRVYLDISWLLGIIAVALFLGYWIGITKGRRK